MNAAFEPSHGKFAGNVIELAGLGSVELTHVLTETTETTIYQITHPGVVIKTFDLDCGKPGEISYGPYLRFGLELANFEDIMAIEELRRFVPAYYGAEVDYERQYAYIAMEYLAGQDLQSWCLSGAFIEYPESWVQEFKEVVYESLSIMTRFHKHGIILIDFKADNIIRLSERGVKFVDLGAFFTPRHHQAADKYLYSATPDYAELLIDASNMQTGIPPTEASDIFSAGVALFEMATGASRLEIDPTTADEILACPETYRFRDSQIRDLWREYPHLKELLPLVETQLKERRLCFAEIWHLLKAFLGRKMPEWEEMPNPEKENILEATGTTFIQDQLAPQLQWLAGPIARCTVLRGLRLKSVRELMTLLENPIPEDIRADLEQCNEFAAFLRGLGKPMDFLEHVNTWETRVSPQTAHWSISAPAAAVQLADEALFTSLKLLGQDYDGHRFYGVANALEADEHEEASLTFWQLRDDHGAWIV